MTDFQQLLMICLCVVFIMCLLLGVHWVSWIYGLIVFIEFGAFLAIVALSTFLLSLFVLSFGDFDYIRLLDIVPQFIDSISLFFCLSFPFSLSPFLPSFLLWVLFWIAYIAISSGLLVFLLQYLTCCWSSPSVFFNFRHCGFHPYKFRLENIYLYFLYLFNVSSSFLSISNIALTMLLFLSTNSIIYVILV